MPERPATHHPLRVKLIFNATSGRTEESPQQLANILTEMQSRDILPEVFMLSPDSKVEAVVRSAIREGIKLVVVAGGDGTIDAVAGAMIGSSATLGIIPTGTRNNVALNLGIPDTLADAVALLREGRRQKIDVGYLRSGRTGHWFLEAAALGLLSDLYPVADDIQHGDLAQIGNLLSTFVSSTPSRLRATLDRRHRLDTSAYMVLISNMPYLGPHFRIAPDVSWNDNRLDVFVFSDMSKINLISYAMQSTGGAVDDTHVKHYRVKRLKIKTDPQMPVLADGVLLDLGPITALVHHRALAVMVGATDAALGGQPVTTPVADRELVGHG
jgi:YegS/Rv2252/BmrU family lipid kinase